MKKLISIFISSVFCFALFGQNPTFLRLNQNTINPHSIRPIKGFQKNDSTYFAAFEAYFGAGTYVTRFHEYNLFGDLKSELTPVTQSNSATVSSLSRVNDDIYLSIMNNGTCCYMFDKDYNIKWNNNTDYSCSIVPLNDSVGFGGCYFKSTNESRIAKLNLQSGDTIFTKTYQELLGLPDSITSQFSLIDFTIDKTIIYSLFKSYLLEKVLIVEMDINGNVVKVKELMNSDYQKLFIYNNLKILIRQTNPLPNKQLIIEAYFNDTIKWTYIGEENHFNAAINLVVKNNILYLSHYLKGQRNYQRIVSFNKSGKILKWIEYKVDSEDLYFNSFEISNDGGFFITGECSYLHPENRAFILKTDSNGFVENPTLLPLQIDTSFSDTNTNVEFNSSKSNYSIFPNPVSSTLNLLGNKENLKNIKLLDLKGSVLQSFTSIQTIDLLELRQGVYILEIETQTGEIERHKIIKK